jgi:hypothetical protein
LTVAPQTLVLAFSKTSYLQSSKQVTAAAGQNAQVAAALIAIAAPQPLDATNGGTVMGARGASLTASPAALVDSSGNPVSGMVDVSLTPLSPADPGELAAYPGSLVGNNGGTTSRLQTYGVLDVTVTQNGQPVQVAAGQTVAVTIPVTASGSLAPTQDLWSFNLATGVWDHEGTAQLAGSAYTAQLSHFSYHNIDGAVLSGQAACVTGLVVDAQGNPVAGAYVSPSQGASVDTLIVTDASGRYCTWVLSGASETITGDATSAPFGEGSITVTGGSPVAANNWESCAGLGCQTVPNIVLSQPPCMQDSDCPSDNVCCMASGQGMCLESFACSRAQTGGATPYDGGGLPPFDGGGGMPGDHACMVSSGGFSECVEGFDSNGNALACPNCGATSSATYAASCPASPTGCCFQYGTGSTGAGVAVCYYNVPSQILSTLQSACTMSSGGTWQTSPPGPGSATCP